MAKKIDNTHHYSDEERAKYEKLQSRLLTGGENDLSMLKDAFEMCRVLDDHKNTAIVRKYAAKHLKEGGGSRAEELYFRSHLFDAPYNFDSYLIYTEHKRDSEKQFYLPRRKQLKRLVDAMQNLADGRLELLAISLPPGVGKTSLALFFLTWLAGRNPEKPILTGSHSNSFLEGAYAECLRMLDPNGEYCWEDVFPGSKVVLTNAKNMMIDIGIDKKHAKRFATLEFSSIGSGNAGKVRAENLLYCDDLVASSEVAFSNQQLMKLWDQYTTDLRQRKIGKCAELHIATRWSVHDVIGNLEAKYGSYWKAEFIAVPALDDNDESNFDYPIEAGFTTEFYRRQRDIMDDVSWRALYMNEPIEREGQLYQEESLRRYFDLPAGEPDAVLAVCDTKDRGSDFCVLPIAYQYGNDFYIEGVVCEDYAPNIVDINLAQALVAHKVQLCQFESNSAGGKTAEKVQGLVKEKGGITRITTKWTTANKETKILVNSAWVQEHCLFKDKSVIGKDKEYRTFMTQLCSYTLKGKNAHDDVPDAMAQLALFCQNMHAGKAELMGRLW